MKMPNKCTGSQSQISVLLGILLILVILNLFLTGVLTGGMPYLKHHHGGMPWSTRSEHSEHMVDAIAKSLNTTDAAAFRQVFETHSAALKAAHDQVHEATKDVANAYEQDPPDPVILETALQHLNQAKTLVNDEVGKIIEDSYAKLSPEGRHHIAELTRQ